jgi:hypothetical protein
MEFENDVFVSYAHIDDQALTEGQPGWIASLHRALQVRLEQLLGKEAKIWRDLKLQGNDIFSDRLLETLPKVGVLVSVLSPRYVKSEWCQRELNAFLQASARSGGARVKDKLRVFKVVKTPIPREQQPAELQATLGYEFFTVERDSGRQRELGPMSPPDAQSLYWVKLDDLAHDIADLLNILAGQISASPSAPVASKGTVYLAETSSDLRDRRDAVRRELLGQGYSVLPDQPLPLVEPDFSKAVREHLGKSKLSVHMVGENYGVVPEDTTESIVVLQHELAIERAAAGDFCRLIWMPPNLMTDDDRQKKFIGQLENDSRYQSGADLLKTPLEDFKTVLHVRLNPPQPPKNDRQQPSPDGGGVQRVYLICDQRDVEATQPLVDVLFKNFEVTLPVFDGDESQVRREHEANLAECDAVMVYYGAGNELWLRSKLRELQKIAGYGRTKPMLAKAVYIAPPDAPEKQRFRTHDALVIKPDAAFTASLLEPFVGQLTQARQVS